MKPPLCILILVLLTLLAINVESSSDGLGILRPILEPALKELVYIVNP